MVVYCIDTSALIAAWQERYPLENFPRVWERLPDDGHGWVLVHGEVNGPPTETPRIDHAWLECGEIVFDPVLNTSMPRERYARIYKAVALVRYTWRQAAHQGVEAGHYGPWHPTLGLPHAGRPETPTCS